MGSWCYDYKPLTGKFEVGKTYKRKDTAPSIYYTCLFVTDKHAVMKDNHFREEMIPHIVWINYEEVEEPVYVVVFKGHNSKFIVPFGEDFRFKTKDDVVKDWPENIILGVYSLVKVEE